MKNKIDIIWETFHEKLTSFVDKRIYDKGFTDDCVQEIFIKIHKSLDSLRDDKKLEGWIFQIARNTISDYNLAKTRQATVPLNSYDQEDLISENKNTELAECIIPFINQLPQKYSGPLMQYEIKGLSQKDISINENISLSGAKSRIQRGRVQLLKSLNECCKFEIDRHGNVIDYTRLQNKNKIH